VEKYGTGDSWQYNTAHANCMLDDLRQEYIHTYIENLLVAAFPLQQWLRERA